MFSFIAEKWMSMEIIFSCVEFPCNNFQISHFLTFSSVNSISKICFSCVIGCKSNHFMRRRTKSFTLTIRSCRSTRQLWNFDCTLLIARARISGISCSKKNKEHNKQVQILKKVYEKNAKWQLKSEKMNSDEIWDVILFVEFSQENFR